MIRFLVKRLIAEKEIKEGKRVTLEMISDATGIHRTTLSKISNNKDYNTTTDVLDKLCQYFSVSLGEVAEHVSNKNTDKS